MTNPLKQALSNILDTLNSQDLPEEEYQKVKDAVMLLFINVMRADGSVDDSEVEIVSNYFKENYGQDAVNRFRQLLQQKELPSIEESCELLSSFSYGEKERILSSLLSVAFADGSYDDCEKEVIAKICSSLEITAEVRSTAEKEAERAVKAHSSLLRSSAGLIAAFVII